MKIDRLLTERKDTIVKLWFKRVLETYPDDTANFVKREADPFQNPVGATISQGISEIFEVLLHGEVAEIQSEFIERTIKIRAIQDFTPSQAVAFIFDLKNIIRKELNGEKVDVIEWSSNPLDYAKSALSPAKIDKVYILNKQEKRMQAVVPKDQLSLAIGKKGINVRLASKLVGWKIEIK